MTIPSVSINGIFIDRYKFCDIIDYLSDNR